jgi:tRNA1(Val) A37 N6-methylase TrmN6
MTYGRRRTGGEHGTVFTRPDAVSFMLDLAGLRTREDFLSKKILDPSVGEGAFIVGLAERILTAMGDCPLEVQAAMGNITVAELDPEKIEAFLSRLNAVFEKAASPAREAWRRITVISGDYLIESTSNYDVVIGNPPYVRYDNIPANKTSLYRKLYPCFRDRCDLYVAFIEKAIKSLNPGGILTYICADRWLTNGYGRTLRKLVARNFHLRDLIKITGFSPFDEEVTAYPSIFTIVNEAPAKTRRFEATTIGDLRLEAFSRSAHVLLDDEGELRISPERAGYVSIEEQGFSIGIGVATGADRIMIVSKADVEIEDDILLPLITRKDVEDDRIVWTDRYVINPFAGGTARLVSLECYPLLKSYLDKHRKALEGRHVAKADPARWYRTIDRITPTLLHEPKLLVPDISSRKAIVLDKGQYYPHHNFYYITGNGIKNLEVLRALLCTEFVRRQVAEKGVLMSGGTLRWQAQTLRKLRLPNILALPEEAKNAIIAAYRAGDFALLERISSDMAA